MKLVLYSAGWCAPCQAIKQQIAGLPADKQKLVDIINMEDSADRFMQAGVSSLPTLIVFEGGEETERHVTAPAVNHALKRLLEV